MPAERRGRIARMERLVTQRWEEPMTPSKPFAIPKVGVWEAWKQVEATAGAAGIDGQRPGTPEGRPAG